MDDDTIRQKLNRTNYLDKAGNYHTNHFEVLAHYVPEETADALQKAGIKGLVFGDDSIRKYPHGSLACHVVGFAGAGIGSSGIEMRENSHLQGVPGLLMSEMDGKHREMYTRRVVNLQPTPGADVYLTIDQTLQFFVETALTNAVFQHHAKSAWAVLERVKTGEILAMASCPFFDPNDYLHSDDTNRLNRAIGYCYEPGSTFKMATIAAALDAGTVRADTDINCEGGTWRYMGRDLHEFHGEHFSHIPVADILKHSSNIGAAKIALTLGPERLHGYLQKFLIGRRTGINLGGEEAGLLHPLERWSPMSITHVPMGHEVLVTSLQILGVLNAIANDGYLIKPQLVDRVTTQTNVVFQRQIQILSRPIQPGTARLMRKLLVRVCEAGGTGTNAVFEGYTVAGKTGTAQKLVDGKYSDTLNISTFCGMVPAEKPELAMIVVVDEPTGPGIHTGGAVCAPVFREVMEQAVSYLSIPTVPEKDAWHFGPEVPTS